jgi:peroxiredoxin Q/BCP
MSEQAILRRHVVVLIGFVVLVVLGPVGAAAAVEIGQRAPEFTLGATTGRKISLSDFRGKQAVLIEFYGADFAPV